MIQVISFVILNYLKHDIVLVFLFQSKLYSFLSGKLKDLTNIYYFSYCAKLQYKNRKNFINLCYYKGDTDMDTKWHFFAMSHGKGEYDGIRRKTKILKRKPNLMRSRS
jgi:hypothetical protein